MARAFGTKALLSADGQNLRVWDLDETGVEEHAQPPSESISSSLFAFVSDGRPMLVTPAKEKTLVFEPDRGTQLREIGHRRFFGTGLGLAQIAGRPVIVEAEAGVVRLFDCEAGVAVGKRLPHKDRVAAAVLSEVNARPVLATVSTFAANLITLWDPLRGRRLGRAQELPSSVGGAVAISRLGDRLVVVTHNGTELRALDASTLETTRRLRLTGTLASASPATIDGRVSLLGILESPKGGPAICAWAMSDLSPVFAPIASVGATDVALTAGTLNGRSVIASGHQSGVQLWTLDGRRLLDVSLDARVHGIALVPPSRIVVSTSKGMMAIDWNV